MHEVLSSSSLANHTRLKALPTSAHETQIIARQYEKCPHSVPPSHHIQTLSPAAVLYCHNATNQTRVYDASLKAANLRLQSPPIYLSTPICPPLRFNDQK